MNLSLIDTTYIRKGVWGLVYLATCDCGCKESRHIAVYNSVKKPTDKQANEAINADYNSGKEV
jgi:hypothetical protein